MIGVRDIHIQADRPQMEIEDVESFAGSPSTIHVYGVPNAIGEWHVKKVYICAIMPDNSTSMTEAVKSRCFWTATIPSCSTTGTSKNGLIIYADIVDENGNMKTGFVLGKTDLVILTLDRQVSSRTTYPMRLVDEVQEPGDVALSSGYLVIMNTDGQIEKAALA